MDPSVSASCLPICAISDTGKNADIASIASNGRMPGSISPTFTRSAPVITTANPPNPVRISSMLCCQVNSLKKGNRKAICSSASLSKPSDLRSSCWKLTISFSPWTESMANAPNSPAASRAFEPNLSTFFLFRNGLTPTARRNGINAIAIQ